ncbi:isopentenyl pyrophosphate isomerase-like protein [Dinothrombium tinctorium]|uniref:isopentenyl-diphosphate Delta-isomerase n=1 Tax=Dinothrombium tinctorium TaxID=1965070 RepID=A0A443QL46_9ACAR|nr:isopentenyl pyrophosphate isomerase-like protein [Dinothrombium tinctorium]
MPLIRRLIAMAAVDRSLVNGIFSSAATNAVKSGDDFWAKYDKTQVNSMKEMCIAVDENDNAIEPRSKKDCHLMENINKGLIHRAFSVLIFNSNKEFLLTRRSPTKITFPGCFTNACCSHPLHTSLEKDENDAIGVKRAAQRRLQIELGIDPLQVPLSDIEYITRILYKAPSSDIWGEAEIDYVLVVRKDVELKPNPDEVDQIRYFSKDQLKSFLNNNSIKVSPWFKLMVDRFLYDWWNNLDNLSKFKDHKTIYKLI